MPTEKPSKPPFSPAQQKFLALNQEQFEQLATFVDFAAEKLTIAFVSVNFEKDRETLIAALEGDRRCQDIQFERFHLADPGLKFLRDALLQALPQRPRQPDKKLVLLLTGLEQSIGMVGDYPPLLQDLNYVRDGFVRSVSHPMLVFLPDGALSRLARFAPDFWAWRMSVFRFQTAPTTSEEAIAQTLNSEKRRESLLLPERQTKIDLLLRLLTDYTSGDLPKTQDNQQTQLEICTELGVLYFDLGEMQKAEESLQQGLKLAQTDGIFDPLRSAVIFNLANLAVFRGHIDTAIQHYQTCLELCEQLENMQGKAAVLHQIAGVYAKQRHMDQALYLFQLSLSIYESIGDVQSKAATLHQMAGIYADQGYVDQAIDLFQQSLEIKEAIGDVQGKAATLHQMAGIYADQGDVDQALALYQQSLEIDEAIGNVKGKAATLHQMASFYARQRHTEQAIRLFQQVLEIDGAIGNMEGKASTLWWLGDLAAQQGEIDKSIAYLQEAVVILDQIGLSGAADVRQALEQVKSMAAADGERM